MHSLRKLQRLFGRDSLKRWMLLRLSALLFVVGGIFLWVSYLVLDQRFDEFDQERYRQELLRVNAVFTQGQASMKSTLKDYAYWDDSHGFVEDQNSDYVRDNFTPESLSNLRLSGVIITDADASALMSLTLDADDQIVPMSRSMRAQLQPLLTQLSPEDSTQEPSSFLQLIDGQPFLIARSAIKDTQADLAANGLMYFLRPLDAQYLAYLQELTAVQFSLLPTPSADVSFAVTREEAPSGPHWVMTHPLSDLPAMLQVSGPSALVEQRRLTHQTLAVNAIGLMVCSLLGVYLIVHFRLLRRLQRFSGLADRHRDSPEAAIRWPVQGADELDNLGSSLNELITEVETRHRQLSHLAEHDPLTGIGNRRLLMSRLAALQAADTAPTKATSSLLLLDLDSFKLLNDGLGHDAGDDVLKKIALRAQGLVRSDDTVARLGGDEFAILFEGVSPLDAQPFAERLLTALEQPMSYQGHRVSIRASAGLAEVDVALSKEDILRNADLALYEAKRRGKGQVAVFNHGFLVQASRRMHLEHALQEALRTQQLEVWFQPIVDAQSHALVGMEALSRWSLDGEYISPDEFIGIAEETGLINALGRHVFDQALAALSTLRVEHPGLSCNVNLSVRQFRDSDLVAELSDCLRRHGLPASALHLELTESMVAESSSEILPVMRQLVDLGFAFHLDDFGTGYSSLDRLRVLPFDTLKLDRRFVTPLNRGDELIARLIINIGRDLGMQVIAEGAETETEVRCLEALGCGQIQGFFFAQAMPLDQLQQWIAEHQQHSPGAPDARRSGNSGQIRDPQH